MEASSLIAVFLEVVLFLCLSMVVLWDVSVLISPSSPPAPAGDNATVTGTSLSSAPALPDLESQMKLSHDQLRAYQCEWMRPDQSTFGSSKMHNSPGGSGNGDDVTVYEVDRVNYRNLSRGLLLSYVNAARPLIVTGLVESWPAYKTWTMPAFLNNYSGYGALYDWGSDHGLLTLEDYQRKQAEDPKVYVAWIANGDDNYEVNQKMKDDLVGFPDFLPPREPHERTVNWVYSGLPTTGAATHRDSVCEGTWTAQLKGAKQWCLSTYPGLFTDNQKFYAMTQRPGDMFIFTVPLWHGTHLTSESLSVHGYFPLAQAKNLTEGLEDLARNDNALSSDYEHCFSMFHFSAGADGDDGWLSYILDSIIGIAWTFMLVFFGILLLKFQVYDRLVPKREEESNEITLH